MLTPRGPLERRGAAIEGFEEAYRQHYPSVVRSAWTVCRDLGQAEELAQEAFVRAYMDWSQLHAGGYAVPWLHRVAMNLALNSLRRRRWWAPWSSTIEAAQTAPESDGRWIAQTLGQLPPRQREAVFLRVVADLSEDDVARLMGCTVGTVKVHKKRGLDRLRELVGEDG